MLYWEVVDGSRGEKSGNVEMMVKLACASSLTMEQGIGQSFVMKDPRDRSTEKL